MGETWCSNSQASSCTVLAQKNDQSLDHVYDPIRAQWDDKGVLVCQPPCTLNGPEVSCWDRKQDYLQQPLSDGWVCSLFSRTPCCLCWFALPASLFGNFLAVKRWNGNLVICHHTLFSHYQQSKYIFHTLYSCLLFQWQPNSLLDMVTVSNVAILPSHL